MTRKTSQGCNRPARSPSAPRFKANTDDGHVRFEPDHSDPAQGVAQICDSLGTSDLHFADGLVAQIAAVARMGKELTARELNVMIATVHAIGPNDPVESLLAAQMAAVHQATMVAARRLNHTETIDQLDSASNMLSKLARVFALQVEALKRYRTSGEQNVRVTHQHVSVTANQAVVGVNQGGGGTYENSSQSHALGETAGSSPSDACGPALLGHEQTIPMPMPGAGCEGLERVPDARRARRGSDG